MPSLPIIDRDAELAELRRLAANPPALVVLRGRRRVGKSHPYSAFQRGFRT